eukprot:CAMPEP_0176067008 /NCGR_PEP_ID=MMETSP0120_2-20121206/33443_1 /TAXON_ID=160619 /ORGANISM="Kryptoperidinium foliaceum, Strain CCMP 1326" /LENGTH=379 /DNA_ID=CAMNT_0017400619 /DNA_START=55 /DNA_END=1194 /DNA_ORIENTATION=-
MSTAAEYKEHTERLIASIRAEADALAGKEHHKERAAKGKAISELRSQRCYIDACRVVRGLDPVHGHFAEEAAGNKTRRQEAGEGALESLTGNVADIDAEEVARLAAQAEAALKMLDQEQKPAEDEQNESSYGPVHPDVADDLLLGWRRRAARLEAKLAEPVEAPPRVTGDVKELESIAQEVVNYRHMLKRQCGYRNRDFKEDRDLVLLEARLDTLAGAFLPEQDPMEVPTVDEEAQDLRQWERRLVAKLAQHTQSVTGLGPSAAKEVERLMAEIAELKAKLSAQGLTEHEQDKHEQVMMRLLRVAELRQYEHHDKSKERKEKRELHSIRGEVNQLRTKIEVHKRRLREEKGLSQKELKTDPDLCELEERLLMLQRMGGA